SVVVAAYELERGTLSLHDALPLYSVPTTATRADPNRRTRAPAPRPAAIAPIGQAAIAAPYAALGSSSASLICGYRGIRLANRAPLVRNSAATAPRACRRAGASGRSRSVLIGRSYRGAAGRQHHRCGPEVSPAGGVRCAGRRHPWA